LNILTIYAILRLAAGIRLFLLYKTLIESRSFKHQSLNLAATTYIGDSCFKDVNMEEEIWKDVIGFEGLYQVSNYSRVKSLERKRNSLSNSKAPVYEKILKQNITNIGYYRVVLYKDSVKMYRNVHRLVALAFLPYTEGEVVNHINGIKTDNSLSNLEFVTSSENNHHAYKTGLKSNKGEKQSRSVLKEKDVKIIKYYLSIGIKEKLIAYAFNVSKGCIFAIKTNRTWSDVK
jgi:hypothetical protein